MGHVSHGPQHDADDAARGDAEALNVRRIAKLVAFDCAALVVVAGLVALAVWQVQRRAWKRDLIARVEARIHAAPTPAPPPGAAVSVAADEYRRVTLAGRWLTDRATPVQATTALGGGYWAMTPLERDDGSIVLVNRGFVPAAQRDPATWTPPRSDTVTGLLRLPEPGGGFLRANDPAADRWYSRDIAAIARARGLGDVAPWFVDAQKRPGDEGFPVAGLTVVAFPNNHFVYACTWAALAAMAAAGAVFVHRDMRRGARGPKTAD